MIFHPQSKWNNKSGGVPTEVLLGVVYERFEIDLHHFLQKSRLEIAGMRQVLRTVCAALTYMHGKGLVHADLKPANILMRPEDFAADLWGQWIAAASAAEPESTGAAFLGCITPRGCIFKVVLGDLGSAELADPALRLQRKTDSIGVVHVCTPEYRPPDLLLGNLRYGCDLDMWSFGVVAAELVFRHPLIRPDGRSPTRNGYLRKMKSFVGDPCGEALGFFQSLRPEQRDADMVQSFERSLKLLYSESCPPALQQLNVNGPRRLADLVQQTMRWDPRERVSAASAALHPFLLAPSLGVTVACREATHGPGSICSGCLDEEVLEYLQNDPIVQEIWKKECVLRKGPNSKCNSPNSDPEVPIASPRIGHFARAFRRCAHEWLQQLQARIRAEMQRVQIPLKLCNVRPFVEEDLADNAWAHVSLQVGGRNDGWHTDGGASLLHAGLTLFGTRTLQVQFGDSAMETFEQRPGSFYVGNMCAMMHNVAHGETSPGSFWSGGQEVQITAMFRSDLFRAGRARRIDAVPTPQGLYQIVGSIVARHLCEHPFPMPDITSVIAEQSQ